MTKATPTFFESIVVIEMTNTQGLVKHLVYTVRVDTFLNMSYVVDRQRTIQIPMLNPLFPMACAAPQQLSAAELWPCWTGQISSNGCDQKPPNRTCRWKHLDFFFFFLTNHFLKCPLSWCLLTWWMLFWHNRLKPALKRRIEQKMLADTGSLFSVAFVEWR